MKSVFFTARIYRNMMFHSLKVGYDQGRRKIGNEQAQLTRNITEQRKKNHRSPLFIIHRFILLNKRSPLRK